MNAITTTVAIIRASSPNKILLALIFERFVLGGLDLLVSDISNSAFRQFLNF